MRYDFDERSRKRLIDKLSTERLRHLKAYAVLITGVLQWVAVCCSGLQWVAVGVGLQCVAVCCSVLQRHLKAYAMLITGVMQGVIVCCSVL